MHLRVLEDDGGGRRRGFGSGEVRVFVGKRFDDTLTTKIGSAGSLGDIEDNGVVDDVEAAMSTAQIRKQEAQPKP